MRVRTGIVALLLAVFLLAMTACGADDQAATEVDDATGSAAESAVGQEDPLRAMVLKGPSAVSAVGLMDENNAKESAPYDIRIVGAPDEVVSAISSGSVDMAVVPTNLAATLYSKTDGGIRMASITTLGSLYIVENGSEIQSFADLKGKTIHSAGQGANPQFILEHLLAQAGLVLGEDVFIEYVAEQSEAVSMLVAGQASVVLLPEPFTTVALSKGSEARLAVDLSEVWAEENGSDFAMSCVIVRTEYLEQNPEAVDSFLADLQRSVEFSATDLEACAELCVAFEIISDFETAYAAIPNCRIVYVDGSEMSALVGDYFQVLHAANPSSIGGGIPDDSIFHE